MSLTSSLITATNGILGAQAGIDVVARNIANVSTEGYTRKIYRQSNLVLGGEGKGVKIEEIERQVTFGLQKEVREQSSVIKKLDVLVEFMSRVELRFGRPEDQVSLSALVSKLKGAFQDLATTPEDLSTQVAVKTAANNLARGFNDLNDQFQGLRAEADSRIQDQVADINSAVTNVQTLNLDIAERSAQGKSVSDLKDQRDKFVRQVNEKLSINYFEVGNEVLSIFTIGGHLLLDVGHREPVTFAATSAYSAATNGQPLRIGTENVTAKITAAEGSIAGLLSLRDTILPNIQATLDDLAFEIANNFSTVQVNGTAEVVNLFTNGAGTAPPGAFTAGFAGEIQLRTAINNDPKLLADPQPAAGYTSTGQGDPSIALACIAVFEAQCALSRAATDNDTLEGHFATFIADVSSQSGEFESQFTFQTQFRDGLEARLNNESSVNTDEELTALIRLEAAFGASARVLSTVQRAVDELLSII